MTAGEDIDPAGPARPEARYAIDGGAAGKSRLDVLAEVMWPTSESLLAAAGVPAGGRCLDVGCGGGHVSRELARIVGPAGSVLGVDLDADIIDLARAEAWKRQVTNVEFRVGSVGAADDPIDGGRFDLGYARFLLSHVSEPSAVVSAIAAAVLPGGRVVVEDVDFTGSFCYPPNAAYRRSVELYRATVRRRGGNADIGPSLPSLLRAAGLIGVQVRAVQPVALEGGPKLMCHLTLERTAAAVVGEGIATAAEVASLLAKLRDFAADPTTVVSLPRIVQAWGSVPSVSNGAPA